MVCPYCENETQVTNSRHQKRTNSVWRRRHCTICSIVFTTHEKADLTTATVVKDSLDSLEPLERDKLFISVYESCRHRPTALQDAKALTDTVLSKLLKKQNDSVIVLQDLKHVTLETLKHFDPVSGTYYKAYYTSDSRNGRLG